VVTHHVPCIEGASDPEHATSNCSSAFVTDLLCLDASAGVNIWVYGHTHYSTDFVRKRICVIAKQRGYVLDPSRESESRKDQGKKHKFDIKRVGGLYPNTWLGTIIMSI
jgi:hypothetical protein